MNIPLLIVCVGSVAACIGSAFGLQKVSPVPPIRDREILQTTSVTGKVSFLTKDAVKKQVEGLDPQQKLRKLFELYVAEVLSLEDTLEFLLNDGKETNDIQDLYKQVMLRIYELEPEPPVQKQLTTEEEDELEYMKSFQKALEKAYSFLKPVERPPPPAPEPVPTAEPTPTQEPVPTPEPTPTQEPVPTPEPTPTQEPVPTPEPNLQQKEQLGGGMAGLVFANGGRKRNITQKHRHPVIRTILYADA
jgi:hypothetical protein